MGWSSRERPHSDRSSISASSTPSISTRARKPSHERISSQAAAEPVPRRRRPSCARRTPAPARGRALLSVAPAPWQRPGRDRGSGRAEVRADPGGGPALRLPGACCATERLDDLPVLVLLCVQPVAVGVPRGERSRIRLGDDLRLPLRGRRAPRARVGRVRVARLPRRRSPPPLGRPLGAGGRGNSPRRLCGSRLARLLLQARRVPGRGTDSLLAAAAAAVGDGEPFLAHEARPGRRYEAAAPDPVHRLRARRRSRRRPRPAERVDTERHRRDDALGGRVSRALGPVRPGPDLRRERPCGPDVRARRVTAPVLVRPARIRRSRPGAASSARDRRAGARAGAYRRAPERAATAHTSGDRAPAGARRPSRKHARQPAPRLRVTGARSPGGRAGRRSSESCARSASRTTPSWRACAGASSAGAPARPTIRVRTSRAPPSLSRRRRLRFNRAAEVWAALSISALLIALAILILASPSNVWAELVVLVSRSSSPSRSCGGRSPEP